VRKVVEERRKIERKRGGRRNQFPSSIKILPLELRKETLDTGQRLKTKVEPAIKFNSPGILS
jgi:hypothetical protein